jgi:hypothetical protein
MLPPLGNDGVRRWPGSAPVADGHTTSPDLDTFVAIIADTMSNFINGLPAMVERMIDSRLKVVRGEMYEQALREVRELIAAGRAQAAQTHKSEFRFTGERAERDDEPADLPNWRVGRTIN